MVLGHRGALLATGSSITVVLFHGVCSTALHCCKKWLLLTSLPPFPAPPSPQEDTLRAAFEEYGEVQHVKLVKDKGGGLAAAGGLAKGPVFEAVQCSSAVQCALLLLLLWLQPLLQTA